MHLTTMRRYDNTRRNRDSSPILMYLFFQLYQQFSAMPVKPPVTIFLLGVNIWVHLFPTYLPFFIGEVGDIQRNCLHPAKIMASFHQCLIGTKSIFSSVTKRSCDGFPLNRLLLSGVIHVNDMHLYYNMLSLSWKGVNLERTLGSYSFVLLVSYALFSSHLIAVFLSYILYEIDIMTSSYNTCAVGFSAVLFCLKYVWNQNSDDYSQIYGLILPTKHIAWAECIIISILTPNVSFIGHLSGILAGVLYAHTPRLYSEARRRYTYMVGRLGEAQPGYVGAHGGQWVPQGDGNYYLQEDVRRRRVDRLDGRPRPREAVL